jgi:hypothetical protein
MTQAIAMRQIAGEHNAYDLHISMTMGTEACAGRNAIFIDDAQVTPAHALRVLIAGK